MEHYGEHYGHHHGGHHYGHHDDCGCHHGHHHHRRCCGYGGEYHHHHHHGHHGEEHPFGFRRQFFSKEDKINALEAYLKELEAEAQAVREHIENIKKKED